MLCPHRGKTFFKSAWDRENSPPKMRCVVCGAPLFSREGTVGNWEYLHPPEGEVGEKSKKKKPKEEPTFGKEY